MNWGLVGTNLVLAAIIGINVKGSFREGRWWLTVMVFWITMAFRDYYLLRGGY